MRADPRAGNIQRVDDRRHRDSQEKESLYRIRIRGVLSQTLLGAFPGLDAVIDAGDTVLFGALPDQAALYGVIGEIEALGLELLEIRQIPSGADPRAIQAQ